MNADLHIDLHASFYKEPPTAIVIMGLLSSNSSVINYVLYHA